MDAHDQRLDELKRRIERVRRRIDHRATRITSDLRHLRRLPRIACRYPIASLLVSASLGFLLSRAWRREQATEAAGTSGWRHWIEAIWGWLRRSDVEPEPASEVTHE
jgi:hypothetical protein